MLHVGYNMFMAHLNVQFDIASAGQEGVPALNPAEIVSNWERAF